MDGFFNATEASENYVNGVAGKAKQSNAIMFGKAIMAGMMIAFGASASSVAAHDIANVGLARLVAGAVFPVGLMMVILLGAELFTGDCMMAVGAAAKKITWLDCVRMLCVVFIGNFVGSVLLAAMVYFCGQLNYSGGLLGAYTIKVALGKVTISPIAAIISGILCNVLVCGAVLMAGCSKDITGKLFASFFVILAFVTSGYEHCVANMYYIPAGLFCKMNPDYVAVAMEHYNLTQAQIDSLNIGNFLVANLLPVTIGNIIGGIVFIGLPVYYLNKKKEAK